MLVRRKCDCAIPQAFNIFQGQRQALLLDAICIYQTNIHKGALRVVLMGEIYKKP
jgi:hypothetical protein